LLAVVKLLSKRWWIPMGARLEGPKLEPKGPRADGVPDRRPGVFEHSRHSVWLLWHLNSVWCLQHLSTPSMDKFKWQNDLEGLHFLQNIMCRERYSNINRTVQSGGSQQKGAGSQLWGTGSGSVIRGSWPQTRGARSQIQWNPPPNLTPGCWLNTHNAVNTYDASLRYDTIRYEMLF